MDQINEIRKSYYLKGKTITQIASEYQIDRKTIRKYIDQEDFNEPHPKMVNGQRFCPKLDPYKHWIDQWLEADKRAPRKQRHTAKRVFHRLRSEVDGFDCSYRTVATYFKVKRSQIFEGVSEGYLPLEHKPGEAQVDFGTADFYEKGVRITGKYLEVSFPYSNKGYMQLFYGENMECLLEGLFNVFRHIGAVPHELWFDNTKVIVIDIIRGGGRTLTEKFLRFQEHFGFKSVFMNPGEGHEKGNVENKVGYQRRNFLVPMPQFDSLATFNETLLQICENDADREHYRHNETIESRFQRDLQECMSLPRIEFDLRGHAHQKANKWGKITLSKGLHEYSVSPKHAGCYVNIRLTSQEVIIQDEGFNEIVRHPRLYGDRKQHQMDWIPYLKHLSTRPNALKYTGVYDLMPGELRDYLASCAGADVGKVLKLLAELTFRSGFENALHTVSQAAQYQAFDPDSLDNLHRKLYSELPELPPMQLRPELPQISQMQVNLSAYDGLLRRKGVKTDA